MDFIITFLTSTDPRFLAIAAFVIGGLLLLLGFLFQISQKIIKSIGLVLLLAAIIAYFFPETVQYFFDFLNARF